jgi:transposase
MSGFRQPPIPREQIILWSQRLDDALPAEHPARLLDELFRSQQLASVFAEWEQRYDLTLGKPPYHPRIMASLYVYGMLNRIRSSRQLEAACHNRIDVIWLMSGVKPDHSTIAQFLADHKEQVRWLFRAVVRVGIKAGLVRMEHQAVDSTTIEASAGRGSVHSRETIKKKEAELEKQIADLEVQFEDNEKREGMLEGAWFGPSASTPTGQLARRQEQRQRMHEALATIERREAEPRQSGARPPRPIASTTDPDCRVMKDKEGRRKPNYLAQMAVDAASGMITATDVSDSPNDCGLLTVMLGRIEEECGSLPAEVSADAGYNTGRELEKLAGIEELTAYVDDKSDGVRGNDAKAAVQAVREGRTLSLQQLESLPREKDGSFHRSAFAYDAASDSYRCPAGERLRRFRAGTRSDRHGTYSRMRYASEACSSCALASQCVRSKRKSGRYREINRTEFEDLKETMRARLASEEGKQRYALRAGTVEPRIGTAKSVQGVRKFLRRGLASVQTEWILTCIALNVQILLNHRRDLKTAFT